MVYLKPCFRKVELNLSKNDDVFFLKLADLQARNYANDRAYLFLSRIFEDNKTRRIMGKFFEREEILFR